MIGLFCSCAVGDRVICSAIFHFSCSSGVLLGMHKKMLQQETQTAENKSRVTGDIFFKKQSPRFPLSASTNKIRNVWWRGFTWHARFVPFSRLLSTVEVPFFCPPVAALRATLPCKCWFIIPSDYVRSKSKLTALFRYHLAVARILLSFLEKFESLRGIISSNYFFVCWHF